MAVGVSALVAVLVGFFLGLLLFKVKQRWCPACGAVLTCPQCPVVGGAVAQGRVDRG